MKLENIEADPKSWQRRAMDKKVWIFVDPEKATEAGGKHLQLASLHPRDCLVTRGPQTAYVLWGKNLMSWGQWGRDNNHDVSAAHRAREAP